MKPTYLEVRGEKIEEGIDFREKDHPKFREAYARFEKARKNPTNEIELGNAADAVVLARQEVAAERIDWHARALNKRKGVNLDHLHIEVFNLGVIGRNHATGTTIDVSQAVKPFLEYTGPGASLAYAINWTTDRVFLALGGAVNPKIVTKFLKHRGYNVREIDGIPGHIGEVPTLVWSRMRSPGQLETGLGEGSKCARCAEAEVAKPKRSVKSFYDVLEIRARSGRLKPKEITNRLEGKGDYAVGRNLENGRITPEQAERLYEIIDKETSKV